MRTEAVLPIEAKCFEMWWPGTELNRRRQPFQGCALPPELPGHFFVRTFLQTTTDSRLGRALRALSGRDAAKLNSRCAGTVRNFQIIATLCRSLKIVAEDFRRALSLLNFFHAFSRSFLTTTKGRSARHS